MSFYGKYSGILGSGGGGGGGSGVPIYSTLVAFPIGTQIGQLGVDASTGNIYEWNGLTWVIVAGPGFGTVMYQETPVGLINNANLIYTISVAPSVLAGFQLFADGLLLKQITDYTIVGTTITMVTALNWDMTLQAVYIVPTAAGGPSLISALANTASINLTNTLGTLTADINNAYVNALVLANNFDVFGTRAAPISITAVGGISFTSLKQRSTIYVNGSGGHVTITANPQIVNTLGNIIGQRVLIICEDAVNTLTINQGNGVDFNGTWTGGNNSIEMEFDGTNYYEINRRM